MLHVFCRMKLTQNLEKPFAKSPLTYNNIVHHPRVGKFVWVQTLAKTLRGYGYLVAVPQTTPKKKFIWLCRATVRGGPLPPSKGSRNDMDPLKTTGLVLGKWSSTTAGEFSSSHLSIHGIVMRWGGGEMTIRLLR